MIRRPTVLVLGAGASMDYGLPSGWELLRRVIQLTGHMSSATSALAATGFDSDACTDFANALSASGARSVDAFLGRRQDLVPIGKAAIAAALIPCEKGDRVFRDALDPANVPANWLRWLFDRLVAGTKDEFVRNNVNIITFNYDRVVEFFLHSAVMNNYNLSSSDAGTLLNHAVKIVHVHGQLGALPDVGSGDTRSFSPHLNGPLLRVGAAGIKILHEGSPGDQAFEYARELLACAERVVFLGFGYHRENMKRLALGKCLAGKRVLGTTIGMELPEIEDAVQACGGILGHDRTCASIVALLRRHRILDD